MRTLSSLLHRIPLALLYLLFGSGWDLSAQEIAGPERGSELTVYVMTMGPGEYVWERFGHNAIWIRDDLAGTDVAYNYGMFSFEQENFILRFIRGENDYWMEGFDAHAMANHYIQTDRSVWAQELNLTPAQRADLRDFLEWNALPENRTYRYDYFADNCSTRVRDAIDRALGGQLRAATDIAASGATYRQRTRSLTYSDPPVYAGLMLGLGPAVDREITLWEDMFIPMRMMEHIRGIEVADGSGGMVPLVAAEYEIYVSENSERSNLPPSRWPLSLGIGLLFAGMLWLGSRGWREGADGSVWLGVLGGAWGLVGGLLGIVLLGLWTLTAHTAAYRNENLFFVTPLLLPLAVLLPLLPRIGDRLKAATRALVAAVAISSILGLLLQIVPSFPQVNAEIIAFAVPVNLTLAAIVLRIGRRWGPPAGGGEGKGPLRPRKSLAIPSAAS